VSGSASSSEAISQRPGILAELGEVLSMSSPIIVTMMSQTMMQFVDAWMLARYAQAHGRSDELAAIGPAGLLYYVVASFMMGLISCNNTFVSQSLGRGRRSDGGPYTVHAVYLAGVFQVLALPLLLGTPVAFGFLAHAKEVQELEISYLRIRLLQLGATGAATALASFFQAVGRPVIPMFTGIVANLLNVGGDYLLIFGRGGLPEWGMRGAALATVVSSYAEAVMLVAVFLLPRFDRPFCTRRWLPLEWRRMRQLVNVGAGAGLSWLLDVASWAVFVAWIVGRLGKDVLAGNNVACMIMHLSFMPAVGLNIGVTALVGRHVGEGYIPRAKRVTYVSMVLACAYMTAMGLVFFLFRRPLVAAFNDDPAVVSAGSVVLLYVALFQFSDSIGIISYGGLKGTGDTKWPAIVSAVTAWLLFLPLGMILGRPDALGLHGAWLAATVYIWLIDGLYLWRFVSERWRRIDIFANTPGADNGDATSHNA
jgi:MATE family multidrug resistance protein